MNVPVCLSVGSHISDSTWPNFNFVFVLTEAMARPVAALCTSGFVDKGYREHATTPHVHVDESTAHYYIAYINIRIYRHLCIDYYHGPCKDRNKKRTK